MTCRKAVLAAPGESRGALTSEDTWAGLRGRTQGRKETRPRGRGSALPASVGHPERNHHRRLTGYRPNTALPSTHEAGRVGGWGAAHMLHTDCRPLEAGPPNTRCAGHPSSEPSADQDVPWGLCGACSVRAERRSRCSAPALRSTHLSLQRAPALTAFVTKRSDPQDARRRGGVVVAPLTASSVQLMVVIKQ